jgi:P27 family predicted phage terminase small subunit
MLELRGSWRANARVNEPQPKSQRPPAPSWLKDDEKRVFETLADLLVGMGIATAADQITLARYAQLSVLYHRTYEFVRRHGEAHAIPGKKAADGSTGPSPGLRLYPQTKLVLELADRLLRMEEQFGLTPSARARLANAASLEPEGLEPDPFFGSGR